MLPQGEGNFYLAIKKAQARFHDSGEMAWALKQPYQKGLWLRQP
ncbi:hypothetical protein HMPREF0281_02204 [Corynebacterium ammoniagenes DSM 20306]|uniref:Uncharacterized protein n=1 Tax=Corynebacterium ammoniagenes DSM 20306 TaxID=649754 RepID=A0ABP2IH06_CORAM|nr:hypothetical protein HMPREF0281_02204 [Corynebacterium ammoniagenes DSM 20306]